MSVNIYQDQKERISGAVAALMSLTLTSVERIDAAIGEFRLAYGANTMPPGDALTDYRVIQAIMGDGPPRERIPHLTAHELMRLSKAFWQLDRRIQRAFYEAESRQGR